MPARIGCALWLILAVAACRAAEPAPPPNDVAKAAAECRQIAYDRVQNLPAVRSGRTTYIPGGPAPYYQACMGNRGYDTYPPY